MTPKLTSQPVDNLFTTIHHQYSTKSLVDIPPTYIEVE